MAYFFNKNVLILLVCIQYFGTFFDDNLFYMAAFIIYLGYFLKINKIERKSINNTIYIYFIVAISIIVLVNVTRFISTNEFDFDNRDWKIIITPIVCIMLVDASFSLSRDYGLRISNIAPWILLSVLLGTISFVLFSPNIEFRELFVIGSNRHERGLVDRNPNMADDVYFFLVCSLIGFSLFCDLHSWRHRILMMLAAPFVIYFTLMILQGQSRGGWLGIVAGISFVVIYATLLKRFVPLILTSVSLLLLVTFFGEILNTRLQYESETRQLIAKQVLQEGRIDFEQISKVKNRPMKERILAYKNGWDLISLHPLVGSGTFDAQSMADLVTYPDQMIKAVHLHNLFLDIWVRQGVFVMLVYLAFIVVPILFLIKTSIRHRRDGRYFYFCSIFLVFSIYLLVENLTNLTFIRSDPGVRIQYTLMFIYGLFLFENHVRKITGESNKSGLGV